MFPGWLGRTPGMMANVRNSDSLVPLFLGFCNTKLALQEGLELPEATCNHLSNFLLPVLDLGSPFLACLDGSIPLLRLDSHGVGEANFGGL